MPTAPPIGQPFAYQRSPSTLALYLVIERGPDYATVDMTTVTSVVATCTQTKPDGTKLVLTWTLLPVSAETTADTLVVSRAWAPGDTDNVGNADLLAVPMAGSTPLPPMAPQQLLIRGPALS